MDTQTGQTSKPFFLEEGAREKLGLEFERLSKEGINNHGLEIRLAGNNPSGKSKGMGVFALRDFAENETVEFCHAILLGWRNRYTQDPSIKQYAYWHGCSCQECKTHGTQGLLPLGFGMVINTAESREEANTMWVTLPARRAVVFIATMPIPRGGEILTWWGQEYYNTWCKEAKKESK